MAGLEEAGCEVTEAASGGQVLRFLQAGTAVDALWTDFRMSEAQSEEVARAYRERFPAYRYVTDPAELMQPALEGHSLETLQALSGDRLLERIIGQRWVPAVRGVTILSNAPSQSPSAKQQGHSSCYGQVCGGGLPVEACQRHGSALPISLLSHHTQREVICVPGQHGLYLPDLTKPMCGVC